MKILLLITGILSLISFVRGIFNSGLLNNTTLFLGGIATAIFGYCYFFEKLKKLKWLTTAIFAIIFATVGFSVFLFAYGRRSLANFDEEVAIVLGAGIQDGVVGEMLAMRLDAAVYYHTRNPNALIIVSGGLGHREYITEAEAMARYLVERGVNPRVILLEGLAYSTYSNMRYSSEIISSEFDAPPRAVVITSDFHIFRSVRFARQAGIYDVTFHSSSTPLLSAPFAYVREVASVIKMWLIGR